LELGGMEFSGKPIFMNAADLFKHETETTDLAPG
jgi:hypothetical protein